MRSLLPGLLVGLVGFVATVRAQEPEIFPGVTPRAPRTVTPSPPAPAPGGSAPAASVPLGEPVDDDLPRAPVAAPPSDLRAHLTPSSPSRPPPAASQGSPDTDALDAILDRLGGLAAFEALGSVRLRRSLAALDERGRSLFTHEFEHEATLTPAPGADTIRWSEALTYGRKGSRSWARAAGVERPDLEMRAGHESAMWGLLLRFPFGLRDRTRYLVLPEQSVLLLGRTYYLVRVLDREGSRAVPIGPEPGDARERADGCDIYLDPDTRLPILLEIRRKDLGRRRIALGDYREVAPGGPTLPHHRTLLGEDGESPSLEIRWQALHR